MNKALRENGGSGDDLRCLELLIKTVVPLIAAEKLVYRFEVKSFEGTLVRSRSRKLKSLRRSWEKDGELAERS